MTPPRHTLRRFLADGRIFILLGLVLVAMSLASPNFLTLHNQTTILKGMSLGLPAAVGFTIVMICGHLDLTIGTNLTLGGMMAIGLQPTLGWAGALVVALLCGVAVGLVNGVLVTKAKVDAFIVTLGMMTATQGLIYMFSRGNTVSSNNFALGNWMERAWPLCPPRVLAAVGMVLLFEFLLKRTRPGRNVYLVGGNALTAWTSGVAVDRVVIGAFITSGVLACLGGALFSIGIGAADPTQGNASLMEVIAAVIIGGTAMTGGKGSVFKSMVALLTLTMLYNGLECLGAGWEIHKIAGGAVLGAVMLYDALIAARRRRFQGQRRELLAELERPDFWKTENPLADDADVERSDEMERRDSTALAITVVGAVACVAIVAIFAMYFLSLRPGAPLAERPAAPPQGQSTAQAPAPATTAEEDRLVAALRSADGQPLLLPADPKTIPPRPEQPPATYPESDERHWYDMEYSGWGVRKVNIPKSPGTGPRGKRVIFLRATDHPYHTAITTGLMKVAKAYGIQVTIKTGDGTPARQDQQVDQAINERPDLVIMSPVEAKASVSMFKRLNEAGIPVIANNLIPDPEGHKYILAWTGPDDWRQFRMLAREFARRMGNKGNYCIVQHFPGWSPFFSRTYAVQTELKKIAPEMKCLAMQPTMLEAEKTRDVVSGWLTQHGRQVQGIVSCDDAGAQVGINQAIKDAGREDIIRVAAGNSKVGMDFVQAGSLHAVTYQSPEADGATPMKLAADWFYGKPVPPVRYLPIHIITRDDVEQYMPAQW